MQYIDVIGSGFLRNMVRVIVGTLVEVGRGKRTADGVRQLLVSRITSYNVCYTKLLRICSFFNSMASMPQLNIFWRKIRA